MPSDYTPNLCDLKSGPTALRHSRKRLESIVYLAAFFFVTTAAQAQLQVELKFKRLQYIAHEPVTATVTITNLSGRDVDLRDKNGQGWFGFEINSGDGRLLVPQKQNTPEQSLHVERGRTVTRKVNLSPRFPLQDSGAYHVRANVYFADLNTFFYSPIKVFQVNDARPFWQKTVGRSEGNSGAGETRTYSLILSRFADHTSLYVRVENRSRGTVYATYPLGRVIAYDEPQTELDQVNQLHVLHCTAPRRWAYSHIGLNGELLAHSKFMETKTRPRLRYAEDGRVTVRGGMPDLSVALSAPGSDTQMSRRSSNSPGGD